VQTNFHMLSTRNKNKIKKIIQYGIALNMRSMKH
jgi:hypothetical protein